MKLLIATILAVTVTADRLRPITSTTQRNLKKGSKKATYEPGNFSWGKTIRDKNGDRVRVANGLQGRAIAHSGDLVPYANGSQSDLPLHSRNDGGGLFVKDDGSGYYYVSNSEDGDWEDQEFYGGVYVLELNNDHEVVDYYPVLTGTVDNCAGGKTPWGTFVSCEEEDGYGNCWQVDPANKAQTGKTKSEKTDLVGYVGNWEAFAWDDEDSPPRGYVTDDAEPEDWPESYGTLNRYTPDAEAMKCYNGKTKEERWCTLNSGTKDYLKLHPFEDASNCGTISWVSDPLESSADMFRKGEGIDITDRILRFSAKEDRLWYEIDLKDETYCHWTTLEGFPQEPDNIRYFGDVLYFCTDGRTPNGIYGFDGKGYFGVLQEIDLDTEAAGVDFSPDGMYMYMSFQDHSIWQFWREDGMSFNDKTADVHYISTDSAIYDTDIALEKIIEDVADL